MEAARGEKAGVCEWQTPGRAAQNQTAYLFTFLLAFVRTRKTLKLLVVKAEVKFPNLTNPEAGTAGTKLCQGGGG
jgi:hypothetical protein